MPLDSVDPVVPVEPAVPLPDLLCFFFVLLEEDLVLPDSVLDEPEPPVLGLVSMEPELPFIESELPVDEPLVPEPVVPPLVVPPDWANAAPAASIEITAKRFHHVFCMRKRSR